jgi:histidinol dehydrogenase
MTVNLIALTDPNYQTRIEKTLGVLRGGNLTSADQEATTDIPAIVREILKEVRDRGDNAVVELTNKLDRASLTPETIRVSQADIDRAHDRSEPEFLQLVRQVIANIREYQEHILIAEPKPLRRGNRRLGVRYTPIDRVAIYVPGGKALYPSTVLMTAVPAKVAGVKEIVMASPPTGGEINPMALALAKELGIEEVYQMGGAVAMAALAYGTDRIVPVQKIVGPGNAFVAEAKRQLFGVVGIDSIAGPSEVLIVADERADASWVAADFMAQAEHDPGSAILLTPSLRLGERVVEEIERQLTDLSRADAIRAALENYSAIIVTRDLDHACELANAFATEHLQIITANDKACLAKIRNAGAIFVGKYTPVPIGDYFAGPSHVLPTGGTAKFFGPLDCNDFRKSSSLLEYDAASLAEDSERIIDFANREGLTAHANAVEIRTKKR